MSVEWIIVRRAAEMRRASWRVEREGRVRSLASGGVRVVRSVGVERWVRRSEEEVGVVGMGRVERESSIEVWKAGGDLEV